MRSTCLCGQPSPVASFSRTASAALRLRPAPNALAARLLARCDRGRGSRVFDNVEEDTSASNAADDSFGSAYATGYGSEPSAPEGGTASPFLEDYPKSSRRYWQDGETVTAPPYGGHANRHSGYDTPASGADSSSDGAASSSGGSAWADDGAGGAPANAGGAYGAGYYARDLSDWGEAPPIGDWDDQGAAGAGASAGPDAYYPNDYHQGEYSGFSPAGDAAGAGPAGYAAGEDEASTSGRYSGRFAAGAAAGAAAGGGAAPGSAGGTADITVLSSREAEAVLPLAPSPPQAGFYQPRTVQVDSHLTNVVFNFMLASLRRFACCRWLAGRRFRHVRRCCRRPYPYVDAMS